MTWRISGLEWCLRNIEFETTLVMVYILLPGSAATSNKGNSRPCIMVQLCRKFFILPWKLSPYSSTHWHYAFLWRQQRTSLLNICSHLSCVSEAFSALSNNPHVIRISNPSSLGLLSQTCSSFSTFIQLPDKAVPHTEGLPFPRPWQYATAHNVKEPVCLLGNHIFLNHGHLTPLFFTVPLSQYSTTECRILHVSLLMSSVSDCLSTWYHHFL